MAIIYLYSRIRCFLDLKSRGGEFSEQKRIHQSCKYNQYNDITNKHFKADFCSYKKCEKALFSLKRIKQLNNKDFKFGTPKSLLGCNSIILLVAFKNDYS